MPRLAYFLDDSCGSSFPIAASSGHRFLRRDDNGWGDASEGHGVVCAGPADGGEGDGGVGVEGREGQG